MFKIYRLKSKVYCLTSIIFLFIFFHPIHIAITEVNYSEKEQSLQIMHKIFLDDLEDHIQQTEKQDGKEVDLRLNTPKERADVDTYLQKYVHDHFELRIDGKPYTGNYIGKEYETDAVWMYIEVSNVKRPKQLEISSSFLIDFHTDQQNFVHFNIGGQKKSLRFRKGDGVQRVSFE